MTTICCLHASVAQKSYGSEKRFLCPPPIVNIQAPHGDSKSALSSKPQVTMSVVCESENNNSLGQRSTLEDDHTGTFRYLYVTGSAKAKSFQLKLQVYGRACLPNGFISNDSIPSETEEGVVNTADLPEPYAVFDSAPIAIISKPSKKTAKARNVSSCILAGSLVSLFNRINSQTVRTKYMSVQDGEFCAKSSTWSSFSVTIVSNGPSNPARVGSPKSHHRQSAMQSSSPITYGAEIILTETATGLQSDRLIVCKVENGRIQENATGPICQMQKVALMSTERNKDGEPVYLSAVGNDHQVGRYMDHSTSTKTILKYQPSTMAGGNTDIMKPGSDDFLCWTIVGISKFEYTYFESLPADSETHHPITPFPTLVKNPVYNATSHTLELVVSDFYSQIGDQTSETPMGVWLGSRGPLSTHIIRRNVSSGPEVSMDQTTLLVDLPQGKQMGVALDEKTLSLPLLFVRHSDGITYNSRATVVFTRPDNGERWSVSMA
ncbi:beta-trefoil DNA-binding domain-containing protein [Gamsiella multidivaricata]|uniref:beta-trefoil DNA-binding domain-containing protein n=1 Tax=Gamsiella multidivaricata TaxID=101098 RepID=UPI0022201148|nr:beta-trefoil DNA-binding domain-containing protein [Gamsiella multidivaricata]KAI7818423.1 beta-trefoil DNA-binding domain-containing protein [Gamsiella multidivaricata]